MKPIRMCVLCRERNKQSEMSRFVCKEKQIKEFNSSNGRSFYICNNCIDSKNLLKVFSKLCKTKIDEKMSNEIIKNIKIKEI